MVKAVIILLGFANSGKSGTLKEFITQNNGIKLSRGYKVSLSIRNQETAIFVSTDSPQERTGDFCYYIKVTAKTLNRVVYGEDKSDNFVCLTPFTIFEKNSELNKDCILKPMEVLKILGYEVFVVYLKGGRLVPIGLVDNFVNSKIKLHGKIDSRNDKSNQARELKQVILSI